ncbi:hypothetical protein L6164_005635 [Bauhinia variegata]|uniref:Uncharacterized protein n=1 Tax=Bauhinia variegata TaxID=167791 RepID=A0ACB9PTS0_BAUVA|nr:hypothetical protein L6164_005635 [Bauhinia variegata]
MIIQVLIESLLVMAQKSRFDASFFVFKHGELITYFLVYVDDLLLTGNSSKLLHDFQSALSLRFSLKDLGFPSYFLGMEVLPTKFGLILNQHKYLRDLLHRFDMVGSKALQTLISTSTTLLPRDDFAPADASLYRKIIGSLQYLNLTRPDVAFSIIKLSQYMQAPTQTHFLALKRLLRYLKGTLQFGLILHKNSLLHLHAYCDSDWAGDLFDRHSTSAYIAYLGRNPISWASRKQRTVARSSTEAEYRAIAFTSAELCWLKHLLRELGVLSSRPPIIYTNNIAAFCACANPIFHSKMKHLALDYQNKLQTINYVFTTFPPPLSVLIS